MNFTSILNWILCLTACYLLSCRDHPNPDITPGLTAAQLRVKSITEQLPNNTAKVSAFRYDQQGRLRVIHIYQLPDSTTAEVENSVYLYPEGFVNLEQALGGRVKTYFGGVDNLLNLSQNNVLSESSTFEGTVTYQYDYNSAYLPTVRRATTNGVVAEVLLFAYEAY